MDVFSQKDLKKLYTPDHFSSNEDNGQITIIGGSRLFHGAPLLSLKAASRIVDMVFFATPEPSVGKVAEKMKSKLFSFIWVPWSELDYYIKKSDALLIGPGFMRYGHEKNRDYVYSGDCDEACQRTREITQSLLSRYPNKRWVIDAGSLQTMEASWIPKGAILTPNKKEFEMLFRVKSQEIEKVKEMAKRYKCTIVLKGPKTLVYSPTKGVIVKGGNAGMTKGGTGDVQAGLTVALFAKNEDFLTASSAAYLVKKAADELYKKVGLNYNADDLADKIPEVLK